MALPLAWLDSTEEAWWWLSTVSRAAIDNGGQSRAAVQASSRRWVKWRFSSLRWWPSRGRGGVTAARGWQVAWFVGRCEVAGGGWATMASPCARGCALTGEAAAAANKWARLYFIISNLFSHPNFKIWIGVLYNVKNSQTFVGIQFERQGETLLFGPTSKSHCIASYKF
jgi:hypothetical protein